MSNSPIEIKNLGICDYLPVWTAMREFTLARDQDTADELWITEHPPIFTQGLNGKPEHVLNLGDIPLQQIDRGGQVTYHGPGQLVLYCLLDLKRHGLGVKGLVRQLENSIIELLQSFNIDANTRANAPGVYVSSGAKIAALGLRIRKGYCYHGLSLNLDMDLEPFSRINPCGYAGLEVTQIADFIADNESPPSVVAVGNQLAKLLVGNLVG